MRSDTIQCIHLTHLSPEFDAAYDVMSREIPPEFLETRDFLRNRLRVRDEGPKRGHEHLLVQDGYTLHLIAAVCEQKVIGAIYGHLISRITDGNMSAGFVTYVSLHANYRRRGIGTRLIRVLQSTIENDAIRMTGKSIFGMVYEIEEAGKEDMKKTVSTFGQSRWTSCITSRRCDPATILSGWTYGSSLSRRSLRDNHRNLPCALTSSGTSFATCLSWNMSALR